MVITEEKWSNIQETVNNIFGPDALKRHVNENLAFIFHQKTAIAIVKSGEAEGDTNKVHFRLSAFPATAAFVACLLQKHIDFVISEHYEIDSRGNVVSESEAIKRYQQSQKPVEYRNDPEAEARDLNDRRSKNLLH